MDKATPTLRQRCDTALQSLPDAPYRAMLAALFDEMLAEVERLAQAAPLAQQAAEPPQEFESAQGRALASAWAEGWAQCRDAEFVGEEAEHDAFNQSTTLAQCLDADRAAAQVEPSAPPAPGADALAARVAELEKDARRLDAVERNRFELTPLEGGGWDVSQYHSETCDSQLFAVGELTARAAIDSAALAAKGQA